MHSYISNEIEIEKIERDLRVTDSMLELFMHFFNRVAKEQTKLTNEIEEITKHYDVEMTGVSRSFIDLKIEEIYKDKLMLNEYLAILNETSHLLNYEFGEFVHPDYLNNTENYYKEGNNISVKRIISLINDLFWLMNIENYKVSNDFKWYETKL
ncbi:hypothetical protein Fleli_3888 [Bernardetia litoralis DSM 6794]|uniref:Uncharacterized protein n=1 Tax=Bernardetia litoralis (strain ATCC 23117 / DSM 6794 / NBRC 15988 / NCIMB 1366 / Fx l1 / Sio-4) TaxID=880071 RepID=I4AQF7_BERLS|nr:hypothetical protein [Bernardetia litoralis]AFM06192.1 hypothetical protein Fleli_3888 [Bernardetia litoralis DSM 6794]